MLPAGVVMTGGASQLTGTARLGREVLQAPVRIAGPTGVEGLTDHLLTPAFSGSLGLLMWGARGVTGYEPARYDTETGPGMLGRLRDWGRGLLP
jgi:cell division protein FtsA